MVHDLSADDLQIEAKRAIENDRVICESVGLFIRWFGAVEHQLDRLMAHILELKDFEKYNVLADRLVTGHKIQRLRRAAENYLPLGPQLDFRLKFFENECLSMRNHFAHGRLVLDGSAILATAIDRMPPSHASEVRPSNWPPEAFEVAKVLTCALWLRDFHADLDRVAHLAWRKAGLETCEIEHPQSSLPKDYQERLAQSLLTKPNRPDQTRP